ncbi:hypothetical protein EAE96_002832 [Botrytis aclada]|nr:hypothetical protein EAE96_002832 [Botrytis aclada]
MYQEGTYLMRKKNLFIKFECEVSPYQITLALPDIEVSFLVPDSSTSRDFKGTVLTHNICYRNYKSRPQPNASFILLALHIPDLCRALSIMRWKFNLHDENVKHIVTLTDLHAKQISRLSALFRSVSALFFPPREIESFLSRKQREELKAPYRTHLKAFPNLSFNGVIPNDFKTMATSKIAFMLEVYSQDQIQMLGHTVEDIINQGQALFGEDRDANALRLIFYQCSGKRGKRLINGVGVESLNSLLAHVLFYLAYVRAKITTDLIQTKWKGNHKKIVMEAIWMYKAEENFKSWLTDNKAELTRTYDTEEHAQKCYYLSFAFRLLGHLAWASNVIGLTLDEIPNDWGFLIEEDKVSLAISEEARRKLFMLSL